MRVHQIIKALGTKWSFGEVAFWMAAQRMHNTPFKLVAEHIQNSIQRFARYNELITERNQRGRLRPGETPAHAMARRNAKDLLGLYNENDPQVQHVDELLTATIELFLNLFYFKKPLAKLLGDLRRVIYLLVSDEKAAEREVASWYDYLARNKNILTERRDNPLIRVAEAALRGNPHFLQRGARDSVHLFNLANEGLRDVPSLPVRHTKEVAVLIPRAMRTLGPFIAAISVDVQMKDSKNPALLQFRRATGSRCRKWVSDVMEKSRQPNGVQT